MLWYENKAILIKNNLKNEFQKEIFQSSLDILDTPIKTKYSNFATNIRELTREVLTSLAPDNEVKNCKWYKGNPLDNPSIPRIDRMMYAIKGGLSDNFLREELNIDVENVISRFNKVIQILNKYTHINKKVYYQDESENHKMVLETLNVLDEFLKSIDDTRFEIINKLESKLYDQILDTFSNILQEIDILSTHYLVQEEIIDEVEILNITSKNVILNVYGSISVEHQYGSDGDFKRGDGIRINSSYPFKILLVINNDNPLVFSILDSDVLIDNSSFFQ